MAQNDVAATAVAMVDKNLSLVIGAPVAHRSVSSCNSDKMQRASLNRKKKESSLPNKNQNFIVIFRNEIRVRISHCRPTELSAIV